MKYTIEGFSQQAAVDMKLKVDDLVILRWFVDFYNSGAMVKLEQDGKEWAWVNYTGLLEQMPIFDVSKQTIYLKFMRLVDAGVLEHTTIRNEKGTFSAYRLGQNYIRLIDGEIKNETPSVKNYRPLGKKLPTPSVKNYRPKDSSTKDTNQLENNIGSERLREAVKEFIAYRKQTKRAMTDKAVNLLVKKLDNLADNDDEKIAIMEQSILNNWAGVFPLRDGMRKPSPPEGNFDYDAPVWKTVYIDDDGTMREVEGNEV